MFIEAGVFEGLGGVGGRLAGRALGGSLGSLAGPVGAVAGGVLGGVLASNAIDYCFANDCDEEIARCKNLCDKAQYDGDMRNIWGGSLEKCMKRCLSERCGGNPASRRK